MKITVELSLYPLQDDPIPVITRFIADLVAEPGVQAVSNQMSTQLRGDLTAVLRIVERALRRSFVASRHQVLVAKFINADLPIAEPPALQVERGD
jgi:uncharacterized protein YqgV (UPF0045/DUF77 family)